MAIVAVSIAPVGGEVSVSKYVAKALDVLEESGLDYELGPMFTTIEGDPDEIFATIREMQEAVFAEGAERVGTVMKVDDRRDKTHTMRGKMESVREKRGK